MQRYKHINILYLTLLCYVSCHLGCQSHPNRKEAPVTLQELRDKAQKIVDSGINEINERYRPYRYADSLVRSDNSATVLKRLDSLIFLYPNDDKIYLCKGYWYYKRKLYSNALDQYKIATSVARHTYPLLLDREAKAYIGVKKIDSAIQKYKDASADNTVYYYELANTFEISNNLDSAFYYYNAYFNHYPQDTARKKHWESLKQTH